MRQCLIAWLAALVFMPASFVAGAFRPAAAADFDFYVLSLTWSPTWCADNGGRAQSAVQCRRTGKPLVVHGLWPQRENGWPESCRSDEPDRVPAPLARSYLDIFPSIGLIGHEWRKHGTCSGLNQAQYLALVRRAATRIIKPPLLLDGNLNRKINADSLEMAFVRNNPGLNRQSIAIRCEGDRLSEIRICLNKSLGFRSCGAVDRRGCKKRIVEIPSFQ